MTNTPDNRPQLSGRPPSRRARTGFGGQIALAMAAALGAFALVTLGAVAVYTIVAGPSIAAASARSQTAPAAAGVQAPPAPDSFDQSQGQQQAPTNPSDPANPSAYPVSAEQAAQVALQVVPGSALVSQPRLVNAGGTVAYEVPLDMGNVYVDASSGQVLFGQAEGFGRHRDRRSNR